VRLTVRRNRDFAGMLDRDLLAGERAVTTAMHGAAARLKADWRGQVAAAGLGQRLANSIRGEGYPKGTESLNASAMVWTKAPKIIAAHESGAVIRAANGRWLAIPTEAAGVRSGAKAPTPAEWAFRSGLRLRYINPRPGVHLLVADGARISGRGRAVRNRGRRRRDGILSGETTAVIFVLIPQARLKKRLNLMAAAERVAGGIPGAIANGWRD
jgi:hypothetical protein